MSINKSRLIYVCVFIGLVNFTSKADHKNVDLTGCLNYETWELTGQGETVFNQLQFANASIDDMLKHRNSFITLVAMYEGRNPGAESKSDIGKMFTRSVLDEWNIIELKENILSFEDL